MYEAALFDMDGLLLDTERQYLEAFREASAEFGLSDPEHVDTIFSGLIGLRLADSIEKLSTALGPKIDIARFNEIWDQHIAVKRQGDMPVKSGVVPLLKQLQKQGTPAVVATSTGTEKARHHLELAGLGGFFQNVIGGDQITNGKPAPDIYLKAAKSIDANVVKCAAFEDSNTGIQAAFHSGARAVQVPDIADPTPEIRALGHHIAPDILSGARHIMLIS
jgi:HAD superfamily hydrolase (TIGR01509 family)